MAQYDVDPDNRLANAIKRAVRDLGDLTEPFQLMTREWYKGNVSIFDKNRQGPGKYADLSPRYKRRKQRKWGFTYPILRASGKLADSMTNPTHSDSIAVIVNKRELHLGTKVKSKKNHAYGASLHFGTRKMPARPFALIGGEQVATKQVNQRRENWINLINDWVRQVSEKVAE